MPDPNPSGLTVRVLREAPQGRLLEQGDLIGVFYSGTLTDGTRFDANIDFSTFQPLRSLFVFTLGQHQVIQGWDQGLVNHRVGEVLELTIPPDLAYGSSGRPGIPPDSTLNFRVVLVGMVPAEQLALPQAQRQALYYDLSALGLKPSSLGLNRALLADLPTSSRSRDFLVGTDQADTITGQADSLTGLDPTELLIGLKGDDRISGGAGRDVQVGGKGADTFQFQLLSDSLTGEANRDLISDFQGGRRGDRLDLRAIDADTSQTGKQPFRFVGGATFHGIAGELRYSAGVISADVDGDRQADMEIGLLGAPALKAGDLRL